MRPDDIAVSEWPAVWSALALITRLAYHRSPRTRSHVQPAGRVSRFASWAATT